MQTQILDFNATITGSPQNLVSIITPAFHAHNVIHRAVQSVIFQTNPRWEMLIVSDDGRNTEEILQQQEIRDPRLRFLYSDKIQSGPNVTRNIALAAARGNFIAPLDADDMYYPERLETLLPTAKTCGMSGDNAIVVDDQSNKKYGTVFPVANEVHWLDIHDSSQTDTALIFVFSTNIINHVWDESINFGADTIFNLRAMEVCGRAPLYQRVLHEYRITNGSICYSHDSFERAENAFNHSLQQVDKNGLGFKKQSVSVIKTMLKRKREQNRIFQLRLQSGECRSLEDFMSQDNSDINSLYNNLYDEKNSCNQR